MIPSQMEKAKECLQLCCGKYKGRLEKNTIYIKEKRGGKGKKETWEKTNPFHKKNPCLWINFGESCHEKSVLLGNRGWKG